MNRRQTLAASTLQRYGSRFRGSLWEILNLKPQSPEGQQFFRHYLTIEKHLLLFFDNEAVPPTNHSSERALRWSVSNDKSRNKDLHKELYILEFGKRYTLGNG